MQRSGGKRDRQYGGGGGSGDQVVEPRVARRIYVGNLSYKTSWQDLKDYFGQVGVVRYADLMREGGPTGRSKGCGIVEFETPDEAAAAIQQLNDTELDGRPIFIREDREDYELRGDDTHSGSEASYRARGPAKRPFRDTGCGARGDAITIGRRVFVSNLSFQTSWQDLKDHFKAAGRVVHADIIMDAESNSKGSGIVEFDSPSDALHAISLLSNSTLDSRQILVREDREDPAASLRGGQQQLPARHVAMGGGDRSDRGGGSSAAPGTQVVVHGLPYRTSWQDLKDMCRPAGSVTRADIISNPDGTSKGWGIVTFAHPSDAQAAIQLLNGTTLEGRVVSAKLDKFAGR